MSPRQQRCRPRIFAPTLSLAAIGFACDAASPTTADCDANAFFEWDGVTYGETVSEVERDHCSPRLVLVDTAGAAVSVGHSFISISLDWNHVSGVSYRDYITLTIGNTESGEDVVANTSYSFEDELEAAIVIVEDSMDRRCMAQSGAVTLTAFPEVGEYIEGRYEITQWTVESSENCPQEPLAGTFAVLHEH